MNQPLGDVARSIARLQVRQDTLLVSQGDTVLATQRDGFIEPAEENGLFVHETRMLSLYRCRIGRQRPFPVALSSIRQDHWMGYYIVRAPATRTAVPSCSSTTAPSTSTTTRATRAPRASTAASPCA